MYGTFPPATLYEKMHPSYRLPVQSLSVGFKHKALYFEYIKLI